MSLSVNTNTLALNTQRNLNASQSSLNTSMQRLSSGLRINSAKDDAAGLAISERFTAQIKGNQVAERNANDGISLAQTAEGALGQIGSNLQRMRELAVQASNATNSDSDRASINQEIQSLATEIDRVAQSTEFNGTKLLDGSFSAKTFQVGANNQATDRITINSLANARISSLGTAKVSSGDATTMTALAAGDLKLNGVDIAATAAGTAAGQTDDSAYAIAKAINASSGDTGVTATAEKTTVTGAAQAATGAALAAGDLKINGVDVGAVVAGTDAISQGANVAAAINAVSKDTGVIATSDAKTGALTLTAADGRNIEVGGTVTNTGLTAATTHAAVTLQSDKGITIDGAAAANAGFTAAQAGTTTLSSIDHMDVLTADNAMKALDTIDGALKQINSSRADLGAYQSRFESVVASQETAVENLSASRGRIQDADFAAETANLSKAQVLQQAGTAMLSQANQSSQSVLSLLK